MAFHVLVVDPNPARRGQYQRALAALAAVTVTAELRPDTRVNCEVALISLNQAEGHGLDVGKRVKSTCPGATVMVYGRPAGGAPLAAKAAASFGVDRVFPAAPELADLVAVIDAERLRYLRAQRAPAPARAATWGELLATPVSLASVQKLLMKDLLSS